MKAFFKNLLAKLRFNPFSRKSHVKLGLYGPPNGGKCVTPDTNIVLFDGNVRPIKDVFDEVREKIGQFSGDFNETYLECKELNLVVPSFDPKELKITPKKISFVYAQRYTGDIYKITTRSGREIKTTPNHPLIMISNQGIQKVMASDLKVGASIAIAQKLALASTVSLPLVAETNYTHENGLLQAKATWHNPKSIVVPTMIDEKLVRFIGYVITESYHTQNRIIFWNKDENLIEDFNMLSSSLFGLQPIKREREGCFSLDLCSKTLTDYLHDVLNLAPGTAESKRIPYQMMGLPDNLTAMLLRTLYNCEGYVSKNSKSAGGKEIEFSTKSKVLAEQVQLLLNRFGIVGKFWKKIVKDQVYYRLSIQGSDNHKMFRDQINFTIGYKRERLHQLCLEQNKVTLKRNVFSLPIMELLENLRRKLNLSQGEFFLDSKHIARMVRANRITYHRIERMADKHSHIPTLQKLAQSDNLWDKITSIEKIPYDDYVYDLTVEDTHTFVISNGLIAHNSTLANRICEDWLGEEMSSVSHIAHETREINIKEQVNIKNKKGKELTFALVDTPGIATRIDYEDFLKGGMDKVEAKKRAKQATKGVIDSIKWLDNMDAVVVVLDSTKDPYSQVNITIIGNLQARDIPVLIAANKVDLKRSNTNVIKAAFPQYEVTGISAKYGKNVEDFYEELFKLTK